MKASIKSMLGGGYQYDPVAHAYSARPRVDRELWHLQKVTRKLPSVKFVSRFGCAPSVSFVEGVRRTQRWLGFLGFQ